MTFADRLEELRKAATPGPWAVDGDDRPGMEWNNHIVQANSSHTICFMTHDPRDNSGQQAAAELIAFLANNADAILELVRAAEDQCHNYRAVRGLHDALAKLNGNAQAE